MYNGFSVRHSECGELSKLQSGCGEMGRDRNGVIF